MMSSDVSPLTLDAWLLALVQVEPQLDLALHRTVQQTAQQLATQPATATAQIHQLATSQGTLHHHWQQAHMALQEHYRQLGTPPTPTPPDLVATVLGANDFRAAAQRLLKPGTTSALSVPLRQALQRAMATLDSVSLRIMAELETTPATAEILAFRLDLGLDQVQRHLHHLQHWGYVSPLDGSFWHLILPLVGIYPQRSQPCHGQTYLSLTAKGYFRLQPVVRRRRLPWGGLGW